MKEKEKEDLECKMFKQYRNWLMKTDCRDAAFIIVLALGLLIIFLVILTA